MNRRKVVDYFPDLQEYEHHFPADTDNLPVWLSIGVDEVIL